MRKRGAGLNSPESEFMFGGPENEQVYELPDGPVTPYQRGEAAVDSMIDDGTLDSTDALSVIKERDRRMAQIDAAIPNARRIEEQRHRIARFFNRRKTKDS